MRKERSKCNTEGGLNMEIIHGLIKPYNQLFHVNNQLWHLKMEDFNL